METPDGRAFYRNERSGLTQWHPPPSPLPPGWTEQQTPDGQPYFLNSQTKSLQWERPAVVPTVSPATTESVSEPASRFAQIWVILARGMSRLEFGEDRDTDGRFKPVAIEKGKHDPESRKVRACSHSA